MRFKLIALPVYFLAVAVVAQDSVPSDVELHSMYCISSLQAWIDLGRRYLSQIETSANALPTTPKSPEDAKTVENLRQYYATSADEQRQSLSRAQAALNRLQDYMLPKMQARDPAALLLATSRGTADFRDFKAMVERCGNRCNTMSKAPDDQAKAKACWDSCEDKDLIARTRACQNPTWLPF